MALKHFVVCMRDTHLRLIGPFDTSKDLNAWATKGSKDLKYGCGPSDNNPTDDPRWQSIQLDDIHVSPYGRWYPVPVVAPTDGPMPD